MEIFVYPPKDRWGDLCLRAAQGNEGILSRVHSILDAVRAQGDKAIKDLAMQIDKVSLDSLKVSEEEFLAAEKAGNGTRLFIYRPLLSKDEYTRRVMKDVKDNFFGGSASSFLSFFVREEQMSDDEIQKLFEMIEKGGE